MYVLTKSFVCTIVYFQCDVIKRNKMKNIREKSIKFIANIVKSGRENIKVKET